MRISDWSSDVCSSYLPVVLERASFGAADLDRRVGGRLGLRAVQPFERQLAVELIVMLRRIGEMRVRAGAVARRQRRAAGPAIALGARPPRAPGPAMGPVGLCRLAAPAQLLSTRL